MLNTFEVHEPFVKKLFDVGKSVAFYGTALKSHMVTDVLCPAVKDLVEYADEVVVNDRGAEKRVHLWNDRKYNEVCTIEEISKMYAQHRAALNYEDRLAEELEEMSGVDLTDDYYPINPKNRASVSCWVGLVEELVVMYEGWAADVDKAKWYPKQTRKLFENVGFFINGALKKIDTMLDIAEYSGTKAMTEDFIKTMRDKADELKQRNYDANEKF